MMNIITQSTSEFKEGLPSLELEGDPIMPPLGPHGAWIALKYWTMH